MQKTFIFLPRLEGQRPTYWSLLVSYLRYLSLTPPIYHPQMIHKNIIGGETLQPTYTTVATPFLWIWIPKSPVSTPIVLNSTLYDSIILCNRLEYFLYWFVPSNKVVFNVKLCGNYNVSCHWQHQTYLRIKNVGIYIN